MIGWIKIVGTALAAAAVAFVLWAAQDRFKQVAAVNKAERCSAAVAKPDKPLVDCPGPIAEAAEQSRRASGCDTALQINAAIATRGTQLVAIRALCSAPVKRLQQQLDVAGHDIEDLSQQVNAAQSRQDAAVSRAEARATSTAQRKAANDRTIQTAPRTADGSVRCDVECLRALARP
jgi:hypothetical protein